MLVKSKKNIHGQAFLEFILLLLLIAVMGGVFNGVLKKNSEFMWHKFLEVVIDDSSCTFSAQALESVTCTK